MIKFVFLTTLIAASLVEIPSTVVRTTEGLLRGTISKDGRYHQYLGVPYGRVDHTNRFKAPLPPLKYDGIFNAIHEHDYCPQQAILKTTTGHLDCLRLYIYSPVTATNDKPLPVLVYIHGGYFLIGSGTKGLYGGDNFIEHGVVMIAINYRLGAEGFLCLGTEEAPGNAGLKDQIAALKWIKKNVRVFGGDPDNVTIFGNSAGGASISILTCSPSAQGLYHKAITQSGSSVAWWVTQLDPVKAASTFLKNLGHNTEDVHEIYRIFSSMSPKEIAKSYAPSANVSQTIALTSFVPCIEKEIEGVEPVITKHPLEILRSGNYTKVPMMAGFTDKEGIIVMQFDYFIMLKDQRKYLGDILDRSLVFPTEVEKEETIEKIQQFYFPLGGNLAEQLVTFASDIHFKYPQAVTTEALDSTSNEPIFYYCFKYSGFLNYIKFSTPFAWAEGAAHGDELFYLVTSIFPMPQKFLEKKMIERMVTMWTNFAKYSNPTPERNELLPIQWPQGNGTNPDALVIVKDFYIAPLFDKPSVKLWNDIYSKYRRW